MFASVLFITYSLIFAYLVIDATIIGNKLIQEGREIFVLYAVLDITFVLIYFLQMVNYGAKCNEMDHHFMVFFVRLREESIKLKLESQQYSMYQSVENPDNFVILDDSIENTFLFVVNVEDGTKHRMAELEDPNKYQKVNEELIERLEVYQETVEQLIEKQSHILEYE